MRLRERATLTSLLLALTCLVCSAAHAQSEPAPDSAQRRRPAETSDTDQNRAARSLFDAGTIAFRQLRYEDALENFLQAYKLTNDPVLLFNIGLTYDRLFRLPEAVKALEDYLAAMPEAPNRAAAEERMRVMRAHIEQNAPPPAAEPVAPPPPPVEPPPPPPPPPAEPEDRGARVLPTWGFWSGLGVTAVLGGVTVWSGMRTLDLKDEFDKTGEKRSEGQRSERRTNVLLGVTGAAAVATAVVGVFFTDWSGKRTEADVAQARLSPWFDGSSAGLSMSQSF